MFRKQIKRVILGLVCAVMLLTLSSCDRMYILYERPDKAIISVELVNYDNVGARDNPLEKQLFDSGKLVILETLEIAEVESFIVKLCDIYEHAGGVYRQILYSHDGVGIKITYKDNSFTLLTLTVLDNRECMFAADYDSDESQTGSQSVIIRHMIDSFKTLIDEYFMSLTLWFSGGR
ncbi:MAG: hypothetical protein FWE84_00265 [Firmicutes bacterium]|nr:hypothetical protein [Bacillota bacterium]